MKYQLIEGKYGRYFIKNHKYHYLSQYGVWGLDKFIWYDNIEYKFWKVKFILDGDSEYIQLSKNKETKRLELLYK